ncbi:MAG: MoaD/ThiS family protein [Candidatus Bathyarchaeia archaeon]
MRVKVEYVGHVKNIIGSGREEEIEVEEGASVAELLVVLADKYGEPFRKAFYDKGGADVKPNYIITVNGYLINQLEGIKTKLNNGDRVTLLPIVSGG